MLVGGPKPERLLGQELASGSNPLSSREAIMGWGPIASGDGAGFFQKTPRKDASWPTEGAREGLARPSPRQGRARPERLLGQELAAVVLLSLEHLPVDEPALDDAEVVDHQNAIEMVVFVLDGHGQEPIGG